LRARETFAKPNLLCDSALILAHSANHQILAIDPYPTRIVKTICPDADNSSSLNASMEIYKK
jgi:hypothetical protein